ncbi:hypothetical protein [Rheinheimera faecalis]
MSDSKSNPMKAKGLADQIELRLQILGKKVNGELLDLKVPNSLTKIREWVHEGLGIQRIGSPSSFVMTHKEHGRTVKKIAECLDKLRLQAKFPKKPKEQKLLELTVKNSELNQSLMKAANQFVQFSYESKRLSEELVLSRSTEQGLREELNEVKNELQSARDKIILLSRKLAQYEDPKESKVTTGDFSRGSQNAK